MTQQASHTVDFHGPSVKSGRCDGVEGLSVCVRPFIDGVIYDQQRSGGISNYFSQILLRLCSDPGVDLTLLTAANRAGAIPSHVRLKHELRFSLSDKRGFGRLPKQLRCGLVQWNQARWSRRIDRTSGAVFHSTYYTHLPLKHSPTVVTVYDMIHERFVDSFFGGHQDRFRAQKRECVAAATRIIAISERTKEDLCEFYSVPTERVDVTPLAVDSAFWRRHATKIQVQDLRLRTKLTEPYFLHVGGRSHYKNFQGLLESLSHWNGGRDFVLAVAGSPLLESEEELVRFFGLEHRVRVFSYPTDVELAALYAGAEAFVYPSRYEGFGLPLLEAMAAGTPVIATRGGSIPEVAGDAAEYFDPDEVDSLIAAMDRVTTSSRAAELRQLGAERITHFSWDQTAALTLASYRRAVCDF